ncbi:hypothetical protein ABMY35_08235 [Pseudoalteromonas sp. BZB3]|uniref:hypothetical protein n=1 Tax=Pseudoalteromonas sp. BZB3 TaxID=3136670 RepID=UPI0032C444B6
MAIDITSISRIESAHFKVALDTDELQMLEPYIPENLLYEFNHLGQRGDKIDFPEFSLGTLFTAYDKAKQDLKNISITKTKLQQSVERIDAYLDPANQQYPLDEFRVSELKSWDLSNHIDDAEAQYFENQVLAITRDYSQMEFNAQAEPALNLSALAFLLNDVKEDITDVIRESNNRHERLRDDIRNIETQLQKLKDQQFEQNTFFTVDAVVSNSGRASTSLRPLALMRVQISDNNYVDIRPEQQRNSEQSELLPSSSNTLSYRSLELYSFPSEKQALINTLWGSTGRVQMYTMDTQQNAFSSNQITFVDNRNQKVILDKLKEVASKQMQ